MHVSISPVSMCVIMSSSFFFSCILFRFIERANVLVRSIFFCSFSVCRSCSHCCCCYCCWFWIFISRLCTCIKCGTAIDTIANSTTGFHSISIAQNAFLNNLRLAKKRIHFLRISRHFREKKIETLISLNFFFIHLEFYFSVFQNRHLFNFLIPMNGNPSMLVVHL